MPCPQCQPFLQDDDRERKRSELDDLFEIIEEKQDKYDSGTLMWEGKARCLRCSQHVEYCYFCGYRETGRVLLEP